MGFSTNFFAHHAMRKKFNYNSKLIAMNKLRPVSLGMMLLFFGVLFLSGCEKEESKGKLDDNGLTPDINQLVPEAILDEMKDLGMPINTGDSPPSIENIYHVAPFILKSSNRESDSPGYQFADLRVQYSEQNNDNLTVTVDYVNGPEEGNGLGGFIVGDNNQFTVFAEINATSYGETAMMVFVMSATLGEDGLDDFYFANFMVDNNGNPSGYWIEEGEGRVIYDSDGFSEIVSSLKKQKEFDKGQLSIGGR
jgi:hypothetical protein